MSELSSSAQGQLSLPIPPLEFRRMVGPIEESFFDNPTGDLVIQDIPSDNYASVLDFGCGCGRIARQLLQQKPRPKRYLGFDLNPKLIDWCQRELAPHDPAFVFEHHDVFNPTFNPDPKKPSWLPMPADDHSFKLLLAWSVFTHTTQQQAMHYLREATRVLDKDGIMVATWFLFEKRYYPMMQEFQNALYINDTDPTNAVIFDREWLQRTLQSVGLGIVRAGAPTIRGFQWLLHIAPSSSNKAIIPLPEDRAPFGRLPPPSGPAPAPAG